MSGRHHQSAAVARPKGWGRTAITAAIAAVAATTLQPALAGSAVASSTTVPTTGRALPRAVDAVPTYQDQRSCDPAAKVAVEAYARLVLTTYRQGHSGGIVRGCGIGASSEHKEGRAFDWMLSVGVPAQKAAGDAMTTWLTGRDAHGVIGGNARRLGVMYVIWNRRMWSTYRIADGWRAYHGASSHTDHVHTSFTWDGATARTSWWDGTATTDDDSGPCRVYVGQPAAVYTGVRHPTACSNRLLAAPASAYGIVWPGQSGSTVKVAQTRLGLSADGVFGYGTRVKLMRWQRSTRVPVSGVLDKPTWARLAPRAATTPKPTPTPAPTGSVLRTSITPYRAVVLRKGSTGAAVRVLQHALGTTVDGTFGSGTTATVRGFQALAHRPVTGVVDAATWTALERAAYPLLPYRTTVLRTGSKGAAVVALQRALRTSADGAFGAGTAAAVRTAQTRARLAATGVVQASTWIAVEKVAYPLGRRLVPAPKPAPKPVTPKPAPPSPQVLARTTSVSAYKNLVLRAGARGAAVTALQRALGMSPVDGAFGARTTSTVRAFQVVRHLPASGVVDHRTWDAVERVAHPLQPYRLSALRVGSRGAAVTALQRALRLTADGAYGTRTAAAVRSLQTRLHLPVTGAMTPLTWIAVEKLVYPVGVKRW